MQAVELSWRQPTASQAPRWIAKAEAGRVIVPQHSFFEQENPAVIAAKDAGVVCPKGFALWALLGAKGWNGLWVIGQLPNGSYAAVCADPKAPLSIKLS